MRDCDFTAILEGEDLDDDEVMRKVIHLVSEDAATCFAKGSEITTVMSGPSGRAILLFAMQWKTILVNLVKREADITGSAIEKGLSSGGGRLRARDRFRLMRRALLLDGALLREGVSE